MNLNLNSTGRARESSMNHRMNALLAITLVAAVTLPSARAWGLPSFFAPAEPRGSSVVTLHPTEAVTAGGPVLVTFGMPFTRGSITRDGLATVRVLDSGGSEIPAYVGQTVPWRHLTDTSVDGASVRIALVQFEYVFSGRSPSPQTVTVAWGGTERMRTRAAKTDPRSAWHLVTGGSFEAGDGVWEPDVYAVPPKELLCRGAVRPARMLPLGDDVPAGREDPSGIDIDRDWPGWSVEEHARHNFFFTITNDGDPRTARDNLCPYKTHYEPWLYDRASAMFMLYLRSGNVRALREAVRNTQYYRSLLHDDTVRPERFTGLFRLKTPETEGYPSGNGAMYAYNECLAYAWWLTGDDTMAEPVEWVVSAHEMNDEPTRWDPSLDFWTERHTALRLLANTVAFEITGKDDYRRNIIRQYNDFIWHQDGAGGALPEDRVDGALWHYGGQHGDGEERRLVASSWMTVLTVDAMVRAYAVAGDERIARFIGRTGTFENAACKRDAMHAYSGEPLWYCDYMVRADGSSEMRSGHTSEHSLEIAGAVAWAAYFTSLTGGDPEPYADLARRLFATYRAGVRHWIRPDGPENGRAAYRVSPWRKYGWEYRPSGSLSWVMESLE